MVLFQRLLWILVLGLGLVHAHESRSQNMREMMNQIAHGEGFVAALDQSGGSTLTALDLYGLPRDMYRVGDESMFDAMHDMRTRILLSPSFNGDRILGGILFEDTMKRNINDLPVPLFLWRWKRIVPFLKIDKGLEEEENGVQLMKPIPQLEEILRECQDYHIFGTKMRSVIHSDNEDGIEAVVKQQFEIGRQVIGAGLIPIIEPEVSINSSSKQRCEVLLRVELLKHLDRLEKNEFVILKLTIPNEPNFYKECIEHPQCLRVVALSGGYSREEALDLLSQQTGMIASFSRALTEGLTYDLSNEDFDFVLNTAISQIYATCTKT